MTATIYSSTSTALPDFWKSQTTPTSNEDSCRGSLLSFLSKFTLIHEINKPIIKNFHKAFSDEIINSLKPLGNKIGLDEKILKRTSPYFAIYPFSEYCQLIETQGQFRADLSIILKFIQQITVILEHNIQKKEGLCDILSILLKNNNSSNVKDEKNLVINPNLMVIELKQFPEVFCFFTTDFQKNDHSPLAFEKVKEDFWMEFFEKDILLSLIQTENLKIFGEKQIISLLKGFEKAFNRQFNCSDIFECLFTEKTICLKNITFKLNANFLHEFYILLQISKLCEKISKNFTKKSITGHLITEIAALKKKSRESLTDLSKDRGETVLRYFDLSNENYKFIISLIGRDDFAERLILLEDSYFSEIIKPNCIKEISPLKMFKAFLMKVQAEIDCSNIYGKSTILRSMTLNIFQSQLTIIPELDESEYVGTWIENVLLSSLMNTIDDIKIMNDQTIIGSEKNQYFLEFRNIPIKYESSLRSDSIVDLTKLNMQIEYHKRPNIMLTIKIKLMNFGMTIENGDEILLLISVLNEKFKEISLSVDDDRRIFLRIQIPLVNSNNMNSFFLKILEGIDRLLVASVNFYFVAIKTFLSGKPTKDKEKYGVSYYMIQNSVEKYLDDLGVYQ